MFSAECVRFTVQGLGLRVKRQGDVRAENVVAWEVLVSCQDLGLRVYGVWFRIEGWGLGSGVYGLGSGVMLALDAPGLEI